MSRFKEMVQRDIQNVFLNLAEFAEPRLVEGREIHIVLTSDQRIPVGKGYELGISDSSIIIHANAKDLPPRKESGELLSIDGREYTIDQWGEHQGMAEIFLSQNRVRPY